jgi:hypothetical protein
MKKLAIMLILTVGLFGMSANPVFGEWVGCDLAPENSDADPENDVINVVVIQDGAEIIRPYQLNSVGDKVRLIDVSTIAAATFQFAFENSQQRRSDFVAYDLKPKPAGCAGVGLIAD